jgi:hypothetical protein
MCAELEALTPNIIKQFLTKIAYGADNPENALTALQRSSTIAMWKKAILFFMPNKDQQWRNGVGGNPTRSPAVNQLIRDLKKQEVHGHGILPKATHPLTSIQFYKQLELLCHLKTDRQVSVSYPCITLYQYHLIGHSDDICNFEVSTARGHEVYDFAFSTAVDWSKNVREERQCLPQICLAVQDATICLHIALATHLETFLKDHLDVIFMFTPMHPTQVLDNVVDPAVAALKKRYYQKYRQIWRHEEFKSCCREGHSSNVGTHSNRKFPATYASHMGAK